MTATELTYLRQQNHELREQNRRLNEHAADLVGRLELLRLSICDLEARRRERDAAAQDRAARVDERFVRLEANHRRLLDRIAALEEAR